MERIRIQRKKIGMTMKELGKAVGVTEAAISHYETGKREPDNEILMSIASTLGCSVDYLMGRDEHHENNEPSNQQDGLAFPTRFKESRERAGLSQKEAAISLDVSVQSVSYWETGARIPALEKVLQMCDLYNVSADYLLGRIPMDVVVNENPPTAEPKEGMVRIVIPADDEPEPDDLEKKIQEILTRELQKRGL